MNNQAIEFNLNVPQARALTVMANEMWCLMGRGSGKTTGIIAPWLIHKTEAMPRSNGGFLGQTFKQIETKLLQPLFQSLSMLGYEENIHFVFGKRPPDSWIKPLTPIIDYNPVLTFMNGTTAELISLRLEGSANAKSLQWLIGDEAKFLDPNRLRSEVFPVLRGHVKTFGKSAWYGAKLFVTDKLSTNIRWILDKKKMHDEELVNTIIYYQLQLNELKLTQKEVSDSHAYVIKNKINKLNEVLALLRKQCVYYGEASARDNIENLGADYFANMRRSLTDYEYRIAIENEDPTRVENSFYPDRTEEHLYYKDNDDDITKPVGIVLDYQASLSPLVSFQVNEQVIPGVETLNFQHALYVKHPLGMKHVIDNFCKENKHRLCKQIYYFYDHTAVAERNMHKSFKDEAIGYFEDNGWSVTPIYMGAAPNQGLKFNRIKHYLQNIGHTGMPIRIHGNNCATMVLSMDMTATKETEKGTKKDKSNEVNKDYPQEQATHFSDCFDMAVWAVLEKRLYPTGGTSPVQVGFRS